MSKNSFINCILPADTSKPVSSSISRSTPLKISGSLSSKPPPGVDHRLIPVRGLICCTNSTLSCSITKPVSRILFLQRGLHHLSTYRITSGTLAAYPPALSAQLSPEIFWISKRRYTWHFNSRGLSLPSVTIDSVRSYRTFSPLSHR